MRCVNGAPLVTLFYAFSSTKWNHYMSAPSSEIRVTVRHKDADYLRLGSVDLAPHQRALVEVYFALTICAAIPLF